MLNLIRTFRSRLWERRIIAIYRSIRWPLIVFAAAGMFLAACGFSGSTTPVPVTPMQCWGVSPGMGWCS